MKIGCFGVDDVIKDPSGCCNFEKVEFGKKYFQNKFLGVKNFNYMGFICSKIWKNGYFRDVMKLGARDLGQKPKRSKTLKP